MADQNEIPAVKPGWQTSEFWVTVASLLTSALVLANIIGPEDAPALAKAIVDVAMAVFSLITAATYIWGRVMLKMK